jgi:hypothetical protein
MLSPMHGGHLLGQTQPLHNNSQADIRLYTVHVEPEALMRVWRSALAARHGTLPQDAEKSRSSYIEYQVSSCNRSHERDTAFMELKATGLEQNTEPLSSSDSSTTHIPLQRQGIWIYTIAKERLDNASQMSQMRKLATVQVLGHPGPLKSSSYCNCNWRKLGHCSANETLSIPHPKTDLEPEALLHMNLRRTY